MNHSVASSNPLTLRQIAKSLELPFRGDADYIVDSVAAIHEAKSNQLSFVVSPKFSAELQKSQAGIIILPESLLDLASSHCLIAADPYLSYAKASQLIHPASRCIQGVHPSAVVDSSATVHPTASIAASAVVESGAIIGEDCVIGAGCCVGQGSVIGARSVLFANVTIYHDCHLGNDCRVQSGAVIGGEGFGYARDTDGWARINQIGRVLLGDRVEVGANTTIDRGAIGDTVIEDGVILDNQIQIAHNVRIGRNTAIAGCTGIAGSTTIGSNCTIAGAVNIVGHLNIVDNVHLTATSFVIRSITEPGAYSSGMPLEKNRKWHRTFVRLTQLDALASKINRL